MGILEVVTIKGFTESCKPPDISSAPDDLPDVPSNGIKEDKSKVQNMKHMLLQKYKELKDLNPLGSDSVALQFLQFRQEELAIPEPTPTPQPIFLAPRSRTSIPNINAIQAQPVDLTVSQPIVKSRSSNSLNEIERGEKRQGNIFHLIFHSQNKVSYHLPNEF